MRGHFYSFITFCRFKLLIQVSGPSEQDPSFWKTSHSDSIFKILIDCIQEVNNAIINFIISRIL